MVYNRLYTHYRSPAFFQPLLISPVLSVVKFCAEYVANYGRCFHPALVCSSPGVFPLVVSGFFLRFTDCLRSAPSYPPLVLFHFIRLF
jgi:hypothetical protein